VISLSELGAGFSVSNLHRYISVVRSLNEPAYFDLELCIGNLLFECCREPLVRFEVRVGLRPTEHVPFRIG
jgi:hypothetical protein